MSHLYLSAAHKSSGKTTLSIGLCAALVAKGEQVQPFKKGPDYIDPLWLTEAAGQDCHNLDFHTMEPDEINALFAAAMHSASIGLIEGNKGLFDGLDLNGANSNAALAAQLGSPVILVLDTQGMTRGVAPLILGYQAFDNNIQIAGVILNKVGGPRHEHKLRQAVEYYTDVPVLGAVQRSHDMHISERHLGLVPSNETKDCQQRIRQIGQQVAQQVDIAKLVDIAQTAKPPQHYIESRQTQASDYQVTIAYAKDSAFGFYYASDLSALQQSGAKLIPFSPLHDKTLPQADALFLGGGFPETHLDQLTQNTAIAQQIRKFIDQGNPAYAECGGLMYLCRNLSWRTKTESLREGKMLGIIPADVTMYERPQGRGYVQLRETSVHPWPSGDLIAAHEFHYSALCNIGEGIRFAYQVMRGRGIDGQYDGIRYKNLLAGYAHLRHTRRNPWAQRFVQFIHQQSCKK